MSFLPVGKLPAASLQAILERRATRDPRVVVGPRVGEDAAVIDMGDRYLIATSDPITFATDDVAWYALQVNAAHETIPALLGLLGAHGTSLTELRTHSPTLEDVFVSLTGRHLREES